MDTRTGSDLQMTVIDICKNVILKLDNHIHGPFEENIGRTTQYIKDKTRFVLILVSL